MYFVEQIWCVLSEERSFETFTPIWSHVNQKEKNVKDPKFEIHNSFNNFGRDPHEEYAWLLVEFDVYFQRRCRLLRLLLS